MGARWRSPKSTKNRLVDTGIPPRHPAGAWRAGAGEKKFSSKKSISVGFFGARSRAETRIRAVWAKIGGCFRADGEEAAGDGGVGPLGDFLGAGGSPATTVAILAPICGSKVEKTGRNCAAKMMPWVENRPKIDLSESGFRPGIRPGLGGLEPGKKSFRRKSRFPTIFSGPEAGPKPGFRGFRPKSGVVSGRMARTPPGTGVWVRWRTS